MLDGEQSDEALMADIYLGLLALALVASGLFLLAARTARSVSSRTSDRVAVVAVVGLMVYVVWLRDSIVLARLLPWSNLIVVGNWIPLVVGWLAGLVWGRAAGSRLRRGVTVAVLAAVGILSAVHPLYGTPPRCHDNWRDGVCLQTSPKTCSPACAATLLHEHGIGATEQEMAELCLTRDGTTWQGLYRGLKRKTAGSRWNVEVFKCGIDDLRETRRPVILLVELRKGADADPIYSTEWGWTPGQPHAVVLFRFVGDDRAEMGDPSIGREQWSVRDLEVLWHGTGVRLVERPHAQSPRKQASRESAWPSESRGDRI